MGKTVAKGCDLSPSWEDLTLLNTDNWQSLQIGCNLGVSLASVEDNAGPPTAVKEFLFCTVCSFRKK